MKFITVSSLGRPCLVVPEGKKTVSHPVCPTHVERCVWNRNGLHKQCFSSMLIQILIDKIISGHSIWRVVLYDAVLRIYMFQVRRSWRSSYSYSTSFSTGVDYSGTSLIITPKVK